MSELYSVERLIRDVARLGVFQGDTLMVHASLRAIGPTEGRAGGLIRALHDAVGPTGTLLMVLGAKNLWDWVNKLPQPQRAGSLVDAEPFDALRTPADPDVGTLAEVFRRYPKVMVSDHPEGRFAALGHAAGALTKRSPLGRLLRARLGAGAAGAARRQGAAARRRHRHHDPAAPRGVSHRPAA